MADRIFSGLNPKQVEAVKATEGPVLVVSGPGSGKTKCLTHRIAHLIASGVHPQHILAVTFTNKAAAEVKERIQKLAQRVAQTVERKGQETLRASRSTLHTLPTVGTFHSLGLRILRREIQHLGYGEEFTIMDSDDQNSLIKKTLLENEIDPKRFNPGTIHRKISKLKTDLIYPEDYSPPTKGSDFINGIVATAYRGYQAGLQKTNSVDFDDLISLPVKIFQQHPEILERYQKYWKYILVDEYQDTSHDQYRLIGMLAAQHRNLFCIGDDAQSIYMFREADIRNILNFQKDYPDGKIILLEQNYRSTGTIIAAAQSIISNNKNQIPKELWTSNPHGEQIIAQETLNERGEGDYIAQLVRGLTSRKYQPEEIAILYRTHAQSRAIEESCISNSIPYRIVGGIKFYDRREIKDILAYLKFIHNPKDSLSFERIANVPPRGIGKTTVDKILVSGGEDLIAGIRKFMSEESLTEKRYRSLNTLADLLDQLRAQKERSNLSTFMKAVIKNVGYEEYIRASKDKFENAEERIENIQELFTVAKPHDSAGQEAYGQFLEKIALLQEFDKTREQGKRITLMTMHASKGLEFPVVFVVGVEEGIFPHSRTLFSPDELEEERRLCYVALTRAKERVFITFAKYRRIFGAAQANIPSRFLNEIPAELIDWRLMNEGEDNFEENTIRYES